MKRFAHSLAVLLLIMGLILGPSHWAQVTPTYADGHDGGGDFGGGDFGGDDFGGDQTVYFTGDYTGDFTGDYTGDFTGTTYDGGCFDPYAGTYFDPVSGEFSDGGAVQFFDPISGEFMDFNGGALPDGNFTIDFRSDEAMTAFDHAMDLQAGEFMELGGEQALGIASTLNGDQFGALGAP